MNWQTPEYSDISYGFEVTMYINDKQIWGQCTDSLKSVHCPRVRRGVVEVKSAGDDTLLTAVVNLTKGTNECLIFL